MISERSRPLTWQMPAKAGERLECAGKGSTSRTSRLRPTNKMNSTPHICQLTEESRSEISSAPRSFRQVRDISSQGRQPVRLMYVGQGFGNIGIALYLLELICECDMSPRERDGSQQTSKFLHVRSSTRDCLNILSSRRVQLSGQFQAEADIRPKTGPAGFVVNDPSVWTGRALQAECE